MPIRLFRGKIQFIFPIPLALLLLALIAYALQSHWLGYYLDDWVDLYQLFKGGFMRLQEYSFAVDRPFGAWPWWIGFLLNGYSRVGWQLWSLGLRWLATVLLWWSFKETWPEKKGLISLAAALSLVYPIFLQQTAGVTFSDHWLCFSLYGASLALMILAMRHPRWRIPATVLAVLSTGLQLFTLEYFVGLELIRPVLIWALLRDVGDKKQRWLKTLVNEAPYLLALGIFVVWRLFFMPTAGVDRNAPVVLTGLLSTPVKTLIDFAVKGLRDVVEALAGAWYKTYQPTTIDITPGSTLISWLLAVGVAALAYFFARALLKPKEEANGSKKSLSWLGISLLVMLAGFLPAWLINQHIVSTGNYADRFGLAALFGASLALVSLFDLLLTRRAQVLLLCVLIGLGAGYQFRLENTFRWTWEKEVRLFWQLKWRAPGLQPGTAVFGDGVLVTGSWVDDSWINFVYGQPDGKETEDYWYYDLGKFTSRSLPQPDTNLHENRMEHLTFDGNASDSLVIQFKSVEGQCLWVADQSFQGMPGLNDMVASALPLSDLSRITLESNNNPYLAEVFTPEPVRDWCYYFEKADLAMQTGDWNQAKSLLAEADLLGYAPNVPVELTHFIKGAVDAGDAETAMKISQRVIQLDKSQQGYLCSIWQTILTNPPENGDWETVQAEVAQEFSCPGL